MLWQQTQEGMVLRGAIYTVRLQTDGIPRLTFVFDGKTLSTFPVASAVDAADKKESVARDAFVIPSMTCLPSAGCLPAAMSSSFISLKSRTSMDTPGRTSESPLSSTRIFFNI